MDGGCDGAEALLFHYVCVVPSCLAHGPESPKQAGFSDGRMREGPCRTRFGSGGAEGHPAVPEALCRLKARVVAVPVFARWCALLG
jgi:hypothetical protein